MSLFKDHKWSLSLKNTKKEPEAFQLEYEHILSVAGG